MSHGERRAAIGLAGVYGFRMLGLFLILPVFALYAEKLPETTPLLAGIAIGIYGLTQAVLQIPFGVLSDKIGRKPVILGGLLLFALGSVIAAMAQDIWMIIVGRAIQGSGAIAAAVMALAADLTRESQRTKAMAMIGMTIGFSFMVALMVGPYLDSQVGVSGIFWFTAILAILGIVIVILVVPTPSTESVRRDAAPVPAMLRKTMVHHDLLRLDWGIFSLHLILTALFLAVPLMLRDAGLPSSNHSMVYLPVLIFSILAMVPFIILAERKGMMKTIFLGAILLLAVAQLGIMNMSHSIWLLGIMLWLFFIAFNLLEATLPSLVSKTAPADGKGTAMGVYSTSQFLGAFLGGVLGGYIHQEYGLEAIFLFGAIVSLVWWLLALGMKKPGHFSSKLLNLGKLEQDEAARAAARLSAITGVVEAVVVADEGVAYLKVEKKRLDQNALDAFSVADA